MVAAGPGPALEAPVSQLGVAAADRAMMSCSTCRIGRPSTAPSTPTRTRALLIAMALEAYGYRVSTAELRALINLIGRNYDLSYAPRIERLVRIPRSPAFAAWVSIKVDVPPPKSKAPRQRPTFRIVGTRCSTFGLAPGPSTRSRNA